MKLRVVFMQPHEVRTGIPFVHALEPEERHGSLLLRFVQGC